MKKAVAMILSFVLLCSGLVPVSAAENAECQNVKSLFQTEVAENRIQVLPDVACPACGAISYPTGKIVFMSLEEELEVPYFLSMYQEFKCSKDSSHIWYRYLAEATE